ncbi:N-acetylmuramoyl-L-alanine amidase-like domain-containing protein [Bradyrhizobium diazoefficiens]|uniref:N-acetylmuramoyl-L-alanine amidase-like domain-containing protein n=1 Tax=Bradyrhizobium diazoefficiens TaxID=1355477 RepID=UPI001B549612|nr:hypothetical protein [Bradyrhizobium japonicum]
MTIATAPADRERFLAPLSEAQRRLWYMSQAEPESVYYNVTVACAMEGLLDMSALAAALQTLVDRHEILRTIYPQIEGQPFQEVLPSVTLRMQHSILAAAPSKDSLAIDHFAAQVARRRINLSKGPVFEAHLLTAAPDSHVLVLLTHHIAIDQHSINTLMFELDVCYDAHAAGRVPSLPYPPSYRAFAEWQRRELDKRFDTLTAFWTKSIKEQPLPLPLPPVARSSRQRGLRGAEVRFQLGSHLVKQLRAYCRRTRSTPYMVLLTALSGLLHRYTGRSKFFVGTTTAFRGSKEFGGTVGCFINTLAIPISIASDADFAALLAETRAHVINAFAHYDFSYERLVQLCRAQHPSGTADFVNVYFQFQPSRLTSRPEVSRFAASLNVHNGRAKFPLMLNASDRGGTIDCTLEYEIDRFAESVIQALRDDFLAVLSLQLSQSTMWVSSIPIRLDTSAWTASDEREGPKAAADNDVDAAFDETETTLATIWHDLLMTHPHSRDASFSGLGGHSLLKAQLAWRIRRDLGLNVRLGDLQQADKFAEMATLVRGATGVARRAVARPASTFETIGGVSCLLELGKWSMDEIEALIVPREGEQMHERVRRIGWAFGGTPFQFESRRPLPAPGRLPIRFGAFDCFTFVMTVLALAAARSLDEFVWRFACLRYRDPEALDSHPESGTIFDFAEEAVLVNAVRRGMLRDVTCEIAGSGFCREIFTVLVPSRRDAAVDPDELWATPKFGQTPIAARIIERPQFDLFNSSGLLCPGDVILMSRNDSGAGHFVDHLGFIDIEADVPFLLQCTRHFARHETAQDGQDGAYTGIFYDTERTLEQIGVGIAGYYLGDSHTREFMGSKIFGYSSGNRRPLLDYLNGTFSSVSVLRPVSTW